MADFNFNLDNEISFDIKENYLPVRLMTSTMGFMGEVAIAGCNPERINNLGSLSSSSFDISENSDTEYFVFPASSNLYSLLKNKVLSMDAWKPNINTYHTVTGSILGKQCIIHVDKVWY